MSRTSPKGPGRRPRPVKQRQPRGLGAGRISNSTLRESPATLPMGEPMTQAERAHHAASMTRRLPLS